MEFHQSSKKVAETPIHVSQHPRWDGNRSSLTPTLPAGMSPSFNFSCPSKVSLSSGFNCSQPDGTRSRETYEQRQGGCTGPLYSISLPGVGCHFQEVRHLIKSAFRLCIVPWPWGAERGQQVRRAWSFYALRTCPADRRVNCERPLTSFRWASDLLLIVLSNESFGCNNSARKHKTSFSGKQLREKLAINCFQYLTHLQIYDGWNLLFQRSEK